MTKTRVSVWGAKSDCFTAVCALLSIILKNNDDITMLIFCPLSIIPYLSCFVKQSNTAKFACPSITAFI